MALLEKGFSRCEQPVLGDDGQLADLSLGQPREQGGIVRVQEVIHPRRRCFPARASALPGRLAVLADTILGYRGLHWPARWLAGWVRAARPPAVAVA